MPEREKNVIRASVNCGRHTVACKPAQKTSRCLYHVVSGGRVFVIQKIKIKNYEASPCFHRKIPIIPLLLGHLTVQLFFEHCQHLLIVKIIRDLIKLPGEFRQQFDPDIHILTILIEVRQLPASHSRKPRSLKVKENRAE